MATGIIIILLAGLVGWAAYRVVQKSKKGGGCCGTYEASLKRIPVDDRNKSHYPYKQILNIGGMTCENCAIRVENALNALPGTWAKVDISSKQATVLTKSEPDIKQIRQAVSAVGYVVIG